MTNNLRHALKWCFLSVLSLILIVACSVSTPHSQVARNPSLDEIRVIKHGMGETQVPTHPRRVVTLEVQQLGNVLILGIKPVGSATWGWGDEAGSKSYQPYLSKLTGEFTNLGSATQPNLEKISFLKPDLIIGNIFYKQIYDQLSQIAPTVLFDWKDTQWKELVKSTGEALGRVQEAEKALNNYDLRTQEFKQKMGEQLSKTLVSVVSIDPTGIRILPEDSFFGTILQDVGLPRPPAQGQGVKDEIYPMSTELIPQMDGDVIFLMTGKDKESLDFINQFQNHPLWSRLQAVKQGRVYQVDDESWWEFNIISANRILDDLFKYLLKE